MKHWHETSQILAHADASVAWPAAALADLDVPEDYERVIVNTSEGQ